MSAPTVSLHALEYFERQRPFQGWKPLWVIRQTSGLSVVNTAVSLYILIAALGCVNTLGNIAPHNYNLEVSSSSCNNEKCSSTLQEDVFLLDPELFTLWYYVAYATLGALLLLDVLRYFKISSALVDILLGFHSASRERWRPCAFGILLIPFTHLSYGFTLALVEPHYTHCCSWIMKRDAFWSHVSTLAFLLFVTGYFLLNDAHHNGYFLLRIPSMQRNAIELLRNALIQQDAAAADGTVRLLGDDTTAASEHEGSSDGGFETTSSAISDGTGSTKPCCDRSTVVRREVSW